MTIYYDVSAAAHARAGLGRYAESLGQALLAAHRDRISLFYNVDPSIHPLAQLDGVHRRTVRAGYKRWRMQIWIGQLLRLRFDHLLPGAELYHATEHLLMPLRDIPTVLTVHDLIFRLFPQYHKPLNYVFLNLAMPLFCRRSTAIIAVSESTKRDLIAHYHIPPDKIRVIYEAAAPHFQPQTETAISSVRAHYGLPERYLMTLCVIEPRKNHAGFLHAFEQLCKEDPDLCWVIGGSRGWLTEGFFAELEQSSVKDRVALTGYIADEHLAAVYSGAAAFVYPSFGEGFGLELLEAMACGTPVISSNATSLPEVGGDAARYFDPNQQTQMVEATRSVLTDRSLQAEMRQRGLAQAAHFSWQRAAEETWKLYQELI